MRKNDGNHGEMSRKQALAAMNDYYTKLQISLQQHENKFDNAVLLVAGGAFTISAAFVPNIQPPLMGATWLGTAWVAWSLCLTLGIGGHLVGAHATKRVMKLLDAQVYDPNVLLTGWAAKLITPINIATFVLLILGFAAFGRFSFTNLNFEASTEMMVVESKKMMATPRSSDGRQKTSTDSSSSATTAAERATTSAANAERSESSFSSVSAAGMATNHTDEKVGISN